MYTQWKLGHLGYTEEELYLNFMVCHKPAKFQEVGCKWTYPIKKKKNIVTKSTHIVDTFCSRMGRSVCLELTDIPEAVGVSFNSTML